MTAREKFKIGDRVTLNRELAEQRRVRLFSGGRGTKGERVYTGEVVGFSVSDQGLRVRVDGHTTIGLYAAELWEKLPQTRKPKTPSQPAAAAPEAPEAPPA